MVKNTRRFSSEMKGVIEREDKARQVSAITRRVGGDNGPGTTRTKPRGVAYSQDDIGKRSAPKGRPRAAPSRSPAPKSRAPWKSASPSTRTAKPRSNPAPQRKRLNAGRIDR